MGSAHLKNKPKNKMKLKKSAKSWIIQANETDETDESSDWWWNLKHSLNSKTTFLNQFQG